MLPDEPRVSLTSLDDESGIVPEVRLRQGELAANLKSVRTQIADAAIKADRNPNDITLIAVTKNFPASDAALLAELGVCDLGENRSQEAERKATEVASMTGHEIVWHFIGQLQRNKVRTVISFADVIHSVDRLSLVETLAGEIERVGKSPKVLVQINLDQGSTGRGGVTGDSFLSVSDAIVAAGIELAGVMAVAPIGQDPDRGFERLAAFHEQLLLSHPSATWRSAGMSGDFQVAIRHGATHLRLGSSILGSRHLLQ